MSIEWAYRVFWPEAIETAFKDRANLPVSVADWSEHEQRHFTVPRSSGD
jgi:hypothetical protein